MSRSPRSWPARALVIGLAGAAAVACALLLPHSLPGVVSCVAGLLVILLARHPLLLLRQAGGLEVGLDPVVVLFLAFTDRPHAALVWAVAGSAAQLLSPRAPWIRAFNAAVTTLSGQAALGVVALLDPAGVAGGRLGAVTAVAAAVSYYTVDYALSAIAITLLGRASLRDALLDESAPLMLGCAAGAGSLGYIGAVLATEDPWSMPLALVPLVTVIVAGHAYSSAHDERMRVRALFTAAERQHTATTAEQVIEAAVAAGASALAAPVQILDEEPADGVSSALPTPAGRRWLAATQRNQQSRTFTDEDREVLDVLASLTSDSLRRLALVGRLEDLAGTDPLTGLANIATFHAALRAAGPDAAVLFCDLDRFKPINDEHGHEAGDELLRQVADRLRHCVRAGDLVGRNGGDEFVVLLVGAGTAEATRIAGRIVDAVSAPVLLPGGALVRVGVSVGIAVGTHALVRRADVAMYAAKESGRSRWVLCTDEMYAAHLGRRALGEELDTALRTDQLVVHYQPIVALATGRVDGVEALVRWQHPTRGLLPPSAFVPLAEESGALDELACWVLRRVAADAAALAAAAGRQVSVSVNVSPKTLLRATLLDAVPTGWTPEMQLILEVTESAVAEPAAVPVLEELRRRGVRIALDDFGTGHSSLATLRLLPVDILKLDRAFTADVATDPRAGALVVAVASCAAALGKPLVVEGIEDDDQRAELLRLGVTLGQGYHLGRPAALAGMLPLLAAGIAAVHAEPAGSAA